MKLQLDTTQKTIKVDQTVNAGELFNLLESLLPNGLWKEYAIETNSVIHYSNPIHIEPWITPQRTVYPNYPWITCTDGVPLVSTGTFNVEISN